MQEDQVVSFNGRILKIGTIVAGGVGVAGFAIGNPTLEWIVPIGVFLASIGAGVFWPTGAPGR